MVNQWDIQGKHAARAAAHNRHAYVVVPPFNANEILCVIDFL